MNGPTRTVEIDRIVLDGLEMTPDQAERFRALTGTEMQRALTSGWPDGVTAGSVERVEAPGVDVAGPGDPQLAADVARAVARAVGSLKAW